ncbi:putative polyketide synthase [Aspergillus aculeatinus CBS 121060]|uniref:Polyketide synthase n=1 Tax=Aspergillus aculeatinus CBS 121060 TaxID=1448322 RepID=A0ACD1H3N8_9EURO|nr:putative polyketide synthase [Aspergillus aculeatinus CBS 121060]RAH68387.1 putative polyketide synthase [Aspergillus aculeatinus CBS 121060]
MYLSDTEKRALGQDDSLSQTTHPTPTSVANEAHAASFPDTLSAIAVVGMAMRLPGDVRTAESFWEFIMNKRDARGEVPRTRYDINGFYDPTRPHVSKTRHGYFLTEDPALFDAPFFSLTPKEASRMDPQQRLLFEVVWECLENAGETDWEGKDVGCFVGTFGEDWLGLASKDHQHTNRYHVLGTGAFALANHTSYYFDFCGPRQTGCSSSLVAIHEACQALHTGSCNAAIVAGTSLILAPTTTTTMSDSMVLSASGTCRTFDADADGYGRGEGINVLYMKRLGDALRCKDRIRALIRSTSSNCDGRSGLITTPSPGSQERLIRSAYHRAGIADITSTGYFECHGTGTMAGDTAELSALCKVLEGKGAIVGAVKPNFGHSEGASGITSVIKAILSLEHRTIPPNLHFVSPNPNIDFQKQGIQVPVEAVEWPRDRHLRASVNGFGVGGANAHIILESADKPIKVNLPQPNPGENDSSHLLIVSAHDRDSLQKRIEQIVFYLDLHPRRITDLAYTLGLRRKHLAHRAFAVIQPDRPVEKSDFVSLHSTTSSRIAFVLTGQGAHWLGMGRDLLRKYPTFRQDIKYLDEVLRKFSNRPPDWCLEGTPDLFETYDPDQMSKPDISQPLCTALQIGLINLLSSWSIRPTVVVGHSSGEIAAAYAAGAVPASSAILLAYLRGQAVLTVPQDERGEMAAVGMGRDQVRPYLIEGVEIACDNSPQSVTVAGPSAKIDQFAATLREIAPDTFCRRLRLNVAYHSATIKRVGHEYEKSVARCLELNAQMLPMFSTLTKEVICKPSTLDAAYWRANLESPVQFHGAVKNMLDASNADLILVEVGPHAALSGPLKQIFQNHKAKYSPSYIPTLIRDDTDCQERLLSVVGGVFSRGGAASLCKVITPGQVLPDLAPYPWQHGVRHWSESRLARDWRLCATYHELLGYRCTEATDTTPTWRNVLHLDAVPWLAEHVIQGQVVFPGAGYIAMVGEAVRQLSFESSVPYSLRDVIFRAPLVLEDSLDGVEIITSLRPERLNDLQDSDWHIFAISSYDGNSWTKHCTGLVRHHLKEAGLPGDMARSITPLIRHASSSKWYQTMAKYGLTYGASFRGLREITADACGGRAVATVSSMIQPGRSQYELHPTVMDQCLQLIGVAATSGLAHRVDRCCIPASVENVFVSNGANSLLAEVCITGKSSHLTANVTAIDHGRIVMSVTGVVLVALDDNEDRHSTRVPLISHLNWQPHLDFKPPYSLFSSPKSTTVSVDSVRKCEQHGLLCLLETAEEIREINPRDKHLQKWKNWVQTQAAKARRGQDQLLFNSTSWAHMASSERRQLIQLLKAELEGRELCSPVADCVKIIWQNCLEIFDGSVSPINLLMEDDRLRRLYDQEMHLSDWSTFLTLLCHSNPNIRILEVGAGTGSATERALSSLNRSGLPMYKRYTFTDISSGFMSLAQERFHERQNMEYKVLDISLCPSYQGFSSGDYDLVIASNVIHATPSLKATLENIRQLLAPGGRLLLHELHPNISSIDFIMGTLPGWWLGEQDGRAEAPYVSPERWDKELRSAGFVGVEALANDVEPPFQFCSTMISRVSREVSEDSVSFGERSIILVCPEPGHEWVQAFRAELVSLDYKVDVIPLDDPFYPGESCVIFLLDLVVPFLHAMSAREFETLKTRILAAGRCRIFWVTALCQLACINPNYGLALGFARTLRKEVEGHFYSVEVEHFNLEAAKHFAAIIQTVYSSEYQQQQEPDFEFAICEGSVHVPRVWWGRNSDTNDDNDHAEIIASPDQGKNLTINTLGLLNTLTWHNTDVDTLGATQVEIEMQYIGLNFRVCLLTSLDLMVCMGVVGTKDELGLEGSGLVRQVGSQVTNFQVGDEVVVVGIGLMGTRVIAEERWCMKLPRGMEMEEAAAMLSVYGTVIYSLIHVGNLKQGQSVLIHSACGGVGLAAIQVCKIIGAEIYATVGNQEKVDFLINNYGIPRARIFDSRSDTFHASLMEATNGLGADLVLNSLAGPLLHASWDCVAPFGKMIELGKRDILTNGQLGMRGFRDNRTFCGVDLSQAMDLDTTLLQRLATTLKTWFEEGKVSPIQPRTVFDGYQAADAFRFLQKGTHIGKILLRIPEDKAALPTEASKHSITFQRDASYLLVGGLGGLGRIVSTWMVEQGARSLIFLSRSVQSPSNQTFAAELQAMGCVVECISGDVLEPDDITTAMKSCPMPLKGVIQMAGCLRDCAIAKMSFEDWQAAVAPKVTGTWNLHHATSKESLDFFVAFGSGVGICGNAGQANYAAANTFLDAFTQYRRQQGLPSSVLDLGAVDGIGLINQSPTSMQAMHTAGIWLLDEGQVLESFQQAILESHSPADSTTTAGGCVARTSAPVITGLGNSRSRADANVRTLWSPEAMFSIYSHVEQRGSNQGGNIAGSNILRDMLLRAEKDPSLLNHVETQDLITAELFKLADAYWAEAQGMDATQRLGMVIDSLVAMEMRSWMRRNLNLDVTLPQISKAKTVGGLIDLALNQLQAKFAPGAGAKEE